MKQTQSHIAKQIAFGIILLLLLIPLLKQALGTQDANDQLAGSFTKTEYKPFTWDNWWKGDYQENATDFLNENFGFRNTFVRMHNQRLFWLYNQATTYNVVVGEEDYLFGRTYIDAYYGTDFIGQDSITWKTQKLKQLQNKLAKNGTKLVVVLAPGKASFYPEYIPKKYRKTTKQKNLNLSGYLKAFHQEGINYIDFNSWFIQMKDTSKYALFPKCGIHWSKYGEYLAADSLVKYINANGIEGSIRLNSISVSNDNKDGDNDIGESLNLLFPISGTPLAYPDYQFVQKEKPQRPVLVIADSFYWGLFNKGMSQGIFGDGQFWYYNKQVYPDSYTSAENVTDLDAFHEISKNAVVFLICTDGNLNTFPFGVYDN